MRCAVALAQKTSPMIIISISVLGDVWSGLLDTRTVAENSEDQSETTSHTEEANWHASGDGGTSAAVDKSHAGRPEEFSVGIASGSAPVRNQFQGPDSRPRPVGNLYDIGDTMLLMITIS